MMNTDVAIVGGGLAGSMAAIMLGRAGYRATLIDPHDVCAPEFRCEKFDASQLALLKKTGLEDVILPATTPMPQLYIGRHGRTVKKPNHAQTGFSYETIVNAARSALPERAEFVQAKATAVSTSAHGQIVTLNTGETVSAELVIMASGLNHGLRESLGVGKQELSPCHSISIGFDIEPVGRESFDFGALTYYAEKAEERICYIAFFPIGNKMRANFFVYRELRDPWLKAFRDHPEEMLFKSMPGLKTILGEIKVTDGVVRIRPIDLMVTTNYIQPGVVLVGDAFSTSCPAAGTGCNKVLTDVERLCNVYIPQWLETPGMGEDKIRQFYRDPVKQDCEDYCRDLAFWVRSVAVGDTPFWRARRWSKDLLHRMAGLVESLHPRHLDAA